MRVLAFALNVPADDRDGMLEFGKGLSDTDEPELWHRDLTGRIRHWSRSASPTTKRLLRAAGRADQVSVYAYAASTPIWWSGIAGKIARARETSASGRWMLRRARRWRRWLNVPWTCR